MEHYAPKANVACPNSALPETRMQRLAAVRPRLLAYARLRLRDSPLAEDVVQEALLAAIEKDAHFAERSAYETWVFGILKYKMLEAFRARTRQDRWRPVDEESDDDAIDYHFQRGGQAHEEYLPACGTEPDAILEKEFFWQVVDACMIVMPDNMARIFSLRELRGLSIKEICREADIKESNCGVILHRARRCLRVCARKKGLLEKSA